MPKSFRIQPNSRFDKKAVLWDAVNGGEPPVPPPPPYDGLCFTAEQAGSTLSLALTGGSTPAWSIETSTDGTNWNSYTLGTTITLTNVGDKVYFRGPATNAIAQASTSYHKFTMTGKLAASGSVMSLMGDATELTVTYQLTSLFRYCTSLTSAPELPATKMSANGYRYMFSGCTSLITPPELPATELDIFCYYFMLSDCSSLTSAPELPVETLKQQCYYGMFRACTSLTTAPYLPATTMAQSCYGNMFLNCTSLNSIKIAYTDNFPTTSSPFNNWVQGVGSTGTFYYNGSDTTRGYSAIPTGWTVTPF